MTFLNDLNRDIVDTHKNLSDLNETLAMSLQNSTKWNIVSRLLSGTGLWAFQNRMRALISIVGEYQKSQQAQLETNQKNAELMKNLEVRTEKLTEARDRFTTALGGNLQGMQNYAEIQQDHIDRLELEISTLDNSLPRYRDAQIELRQHQQLLEQVNETIGNTVDVYEERNRIMQHYGLTDEEDANAIMNARLELMEQAAETQDRILRGTDEQRRLQGELLLQQIEYNNEEENLNQLIASNRRTARNQGTFFGMGGSAAGKKASADAKDFALQKRAMKAQMLRTKISIMWQKLAAKAGQIWNIIKIAGSVVKKFLLYAPFVVLGLVLVFKLVRNLWPFLTEIWSAFWEGYQESMEGFGSFMEIFGDIWSGFMTLITAIFEGDLVKAFWEGLGPIFVGLAKIAIKLFILSAALVITLLVAVFWQGLDTIYNFFAGIYDGFVNGEWDKLKKSVSTIATYIAVIAGAVLLYQYYIAGIALSVGWIGAFVIALGAVLASGMAEGGIAKGGLTLVGERGPELVNLPRGSRVHSNAESRKMGGNTINVHVNGRVGASDQEIRDIARKVGVQINREINRTTSSGTRM